MSCGHWGLGLSQVDFTCSICLKNINSKTLFFPTLTKKNMQIIKILVLDDKLIQIFFLISVVFSKLLRIVTTNYLFYPDILIQ